MCVAILAGPHLEISAITDKYLPMETNEENLDLDDLDHSFWMMTPIALMILSLFLQSTTM